MTCLNSAIADVRPEPQYSGDISLAEMFHTLCQRIIRYCPNELACAYAARGLELVTEDAIKAQIPYLLVNMSHWRGDMARQIKLALRSF